jgi:hypothetical protein
MVAQSDVGRAGGIRRARRELEVRRPPVGSSQTEDEFLGREMTGVARLERLDIARERDRERPPERRSDPRPRLERRRRALAAFDLGVPRTADPDQGG